MPEELTIEADEYIFTLAPALSPGIILNEPLCYYGMHAGKFISVWKIRPGESPAEDEVLEVLLSELPRKLSEFGVSRK